MTSCINAWDCIWTPPSVKICVEGVGSGPYVKYGYLVSVKVPRDDLPVTSTVAFTSFRVSINNGLGRRRSDGGKEDFMFSQNVVKGTDNSLALKR